MPTRAITAPPDDLSLNADAFRRSLEYEGKSHKTIASYDESTRQLAAFLAVAGMPLAVARGTTQKAFTTSIVQSDPLSRGSLNERFAVVAEAAFTLAFNPNRPD